MTATATMSAAELLQRLQRHYIKPSELMPGGAFLPEVSLDSRRADALYVGFFKSRGKLLIGHELKVARSDWLHELDQPAKAETWVPNCHAWYVVAPSTDIVRPEELPEGWGLLIPGRSKTRMTVVMKAAVHEDRTPSWAATHALVQKIDSLRMRAIEADRESTRTRYYADLNEQVELRLASHTGDATLQRERDELRTQLDELAEILGLKIKKYAWEDGEVSINEIRTSFASWLDADKNIQRALGRRDFDLEYARDKVADALAAMAKVRGGEQ